MISQRYYTDTTVTVAIKSLDCQEGCTYCKLTTAVSVQERENSLDKSTRGAV